MELTRIPPVAKPADAAIVAAAAPAAVEAGSQVAQAQKQADSRLRSYSDSSTDGESQFEESVVRDGKADVEMARLDGKAAHVVIDVASARAGRAFVYAEEGQQLAFDAAMSQLHIRDLADIVASYVEPEPPAGIPPAQPDTATNCCDVLVGIGAVSAGMTALGCFVAAGTATALTIAGEDEPEWQTALWAFAYTSSYIGAAAWVLYCCCAR